MITEKEFTKHMKAGSKNEQSALLAEMVQDYLDEGGVITRKERSQDYQEVKTFWEQDPDTGKLKQILV